MTKPISPAEAKKLQYTYIPEAVYAAVNKFLVQKANSKNITIKVKDVIEEIERTSDITSTDLYDNYWLDIEPAYKEQGWIVFYDKPGWNENYDSFWKFTVPS